MYLARATSKRAVKLEEQVVVSALSGVDDMGFGFNVSERILTLTVVEEGKGKDRLCALHLVGGLAACGLVSSCLVSVISRRRAA